MPDLSAARRPRAPSTSTLKRPDSQGGPSPWGFGGGGAASSLPPKGSFGALKPKGMVVVARQRRS